MRSFAIAAGLLLIGCQGKKTEPATAGSGSGSAKAAVGSGSGSAGSGSAAAPPSNVLVLPKGPGTPPVKTTAKIPKDTLEKMSKMEFPGFRADIQKATADGIFEVRLKTLERPRISITSVVRPCGKLDCDPMDLATWQKHTESLKQSLSPALRNLKDTTFEVGAADLHGATAIYTYQLGQLFGTDENNQPVSEYSDSYTLFWNDGVNRITIVSQYADDPMGTLDMMKNVAPKEDLEKIAAAFLDVYTHAWADAPAAPPKP